METSDRLSPSLDREMTIRAAEHEMFLSFTDDWQAEAFEVWWNQYGVRAWAEWAENNRSDFE